MTSTVQDKTVLENLEIYMHIYKLWAGRTGFVQLYQIKIQGLFKDNLKILED